MPRISDYDYFKKLLVTNESARETGFNYTISEFDLLLDLKCLLRDFYTATFDLEGQRLKIGFNNGQVFYIEVKREKEQTKG